MLMNPEMRRKLILLVMIFHLGATGALIGWWRHVILRQAGQIRMLHAKVDFEGATVDRVRLWAKTRRMVNWEAAWFMAVILSSGGFLYWLYWRDLKRSRATRAFFASITHELKTPLTSIRLQGETLAECKTDDKYQEDLIRRLLEDTGKLQEIIERTLELARVEGGARVPVDEINIKTLVERHLRWWVEDHPDRMVIENRLKDQIVMANASAVRIILTNLLNNSLVHGGRDRVKAGFSLISLGRKVCLEYQDDGLEHSGFPRKLGKLFEKGPRSQGAGVGLYLVRTLMHRMGGQASFEAGSGFKVRLVFQAGKTVG